MEISLYETRKRKLAHYFQKFKQLPSYDELAEIFAVKSKGSLYRYVQKFIADGLIERGATGKLVATEKLFGVRVLGTVQAGFPTAAEEETGDAKSLDQWLIQNPEASYLLSVSGDSMTDAGIVEGDMVIVDRSKKPRTGDIVVAEVDGDWTMKYYIERGGRILLRPANKRYPDIHPQTELKVAGVVTSVIRKY